MVTHVPFHLHLSESRSTRLLFAVWWFKVGGVILGIGVLLFFLAPLVARITHETLPADPSLSPATPLIVGAMAVALFWTGRLLDRRDRRGALLGAALTIYPLVLAPITGMSPDRTSLLLTVGTVILLASVWRELAWHPTSGTPTDSH